MTLSIEEVQHIADLARLDLGENELRRYQKQLSAILEYAGKLLEINTSGIPPTSSVLPARSGLREDLPRPGLPVDVLMRNAPSREDDQFRVPPIFGEE